MTVLTIEPDELLGLNALVLLSRATDQDAAPLTADDTAGKARELLRMAIADKLDAAGLPWAPSEDAVRDRLSPPSRPLDRMRGLLASEKARRYGLSALAVAVLVLLWGGYGDGWQWTGFAGNGQLWDWLHLLLLPVILGTFPLWIQQRDYISRTRRTIYVVALLAWIGFVIAGYVVPLNWTGFRGNTLWDWFELLLLPLALATFKIWPTLNRSLSPYHKGGIATLSVAWVITLVGGYGARWGWTGYPGNTLWDWLQLLLAPVLFPTIVIPAVIRWVSGDAAGRAEKARTAAVLGLKDAPETAAAPAE